MPALKIAEIYDYLILKMDDFGLLINYILGDGAFEKFYPSEKYALMLLTNFFIYVVAIILFFIFLAALRFILKRV